MKDAGANKAINVNFETTRTSLKVCATSKKKVNEKVCATSKKKVSEKVCATSTEELSEKAAAIKQLRLFYQARRETYLFPQNKELTKYPNVNYVPLKEEDQKSWLDFKKIDEGRPVISIGGDELSEKGRWPINLDHPFIPVISDFSVAAFNEVREIHVKKKKSNNICHYEVMDCKYINMCESHCFYMTMEAIKEGILGVYNVLVGCDYNDGSRTLVNFILTDHTPTGKIAMMLPCLSRLKSKCETLKGMKKDLELNMETVVKYMEGKNKRKMAVRLDLLKEKHKIVNGKCNKLYKQIRSQIPKTWNDGNEGDSVADWQIINGWTSGLKFREKNVTCKGYDYYSNSNAFAIFGLWY